MTGWAALLLLLVLVIPKILVLEPVLGKVDAVVVVDAAVDGDRSPVIEYPPEENWGKLYVLE